MSNKNVNKDIRTIASRLPICCNIKRIGPAGLISHRERAGAYQLGILYMST